MRRIAGGGFVLVLAAALAAPAWSETYFGFNIGITNVPPPPVVFYDEPVVTAVPGYPVYVVDDTPYDMFHYGPSWYLFNAGFWYRAHSYGGPFVAVDVRYVPRQVLYVPASHWKHRYGRSWARGGYGNGSGSWGGGYRDRGYGYRDRDYGRDYRGSNRGRGNGRGRNWQGRGSRDGEWRHGPVADAQYRQGGLSDRHGRGYQEGKGSYQGKNKGSRKHRKGD